MMEPKKTLGQAEQGVPLEELPLAEPEEQLAGIKSLTLVPEEMTRKKQRKRPKRKQMSKLRRKAKRRKLKLPSLQQLELEKMQPLRV
jgi:hypothetical protein